MMAEQFPTDDSALSAYVEKELKAALDGLPVFWRMGDGLTLVRGADGNGEWSWTRHGQRRLAWTISTRVATNPGSIIDHVVFYYDLWISRDLETFLLTHSNVTAGLWNSKWLLRNCTTIPFRVLTHGHELLLHSQPLTLAQVVVDTIWKCQPNFDWPT
jgi:hypothetical protein